MGNTSRGAVELQAHGHTPDLDRPLSFEQDGAGPTTEPQRRSGTEDTEGSGVGTMKFYVFLSGCAGGRNIFGGSIVIS